jgi:hypothetical protein
MYRPIIKLPADIEGKLKIVQKLIENEILWCGTYNSLEQVKETLERCANYAYIVVCKAPEEEAVCVLEFYFFSEEEMIACKYKPFCNSINQLLYFLATHPRQII